MRYAADVCDTAALERAMNAVFAVVHLAGVADPSAPFDDVLSANIEGTYPGSRGGPTCRRSEDRLCEQQPHERFRAALGSSHAWRWRPP